MVLIYILLALFVFSMILKFLGKNKKRICKTFGHKWNGCICSRCHLTRDEGHDWNGCKCRVCGKTRDEGHDWDVCKCGVCGERRDDAEHDWDGCLCRRCGKWRDEGHESKDGCCTKCGENLSPQCACCKMRLTPENRMRGTALAVCKDCYYKAKRVGQHRLISYNYPKQYDLETRCLVCGGTFNSYDEGQGGGMDFEKEPCR